MGRKKLDPTSKTNRIAISLTEQDKETLRYLSKNLGMNRSEIIRYLIDTAKKDQVLRNILVNRKVAEMENRYKSLEKEIQNNGYHTYQRKDGSYFTYYVKPSESVDQQEDYTHEYVSDEEINELLANLTPIEELKR